jgi:phosphoribosylamine--glycine ligase
MNVAVIGGGGREHAIIWKIKQSPLCGKVYCLPGNAGIAQIAQCAPHVNINNHGEVIEYLKSIPDIGFVIVSPDNQLADGLVDALNGAGYKTFGPVKKAAEIEGSKVFAKNLMKKYGIPTAAFEVFSDYGKALSYIKDRRCPLVIKADGLAYGKGVIICHSCDEAADALKSIMIDKQFGASGDSVVIEEFLRGREVSMLCFTDGSAVIPMVSSQDYKRALDGNKGLNTGGMGAISPAPAYDEEVAAYTLNNIIYPTINAMNAEGRKFKGVLYFGLMVTDDKKVYVVEYNCRFGDPETQAVLPRLNSDLLEIMLAVSDEKLGEKTVRWSDDCSVCVMLASGGYPQSYKSGCKINIGEVSGALLFHSGTKVSDSGEILTAGGRVLGVCALGENVEKARQKAYKNIKKISFDNMFYRKDIGLL